MSCKLLKGACYCGATTYDVLDAFEYAYICHCSQCRRETGALSKPLAGIPVEKLILHATQPLLCYGDDEAHAARCGKCGSLLYSRVREGKYLHIAMGSLIDTPSIRPSAHIFVGSKADWETISDDLPRHGEFPE